MGKDEGPLELPEPPRRRGTRWVSWLCSLGLIAWLNHEVASTWGLVHLIYVWVGLGVVGGFVLGVASRADPGVCLHSAHYGSLPGLLAGFLFCAIMACLGYEEDPRPGREAEAEFGRLVAEMRVTARTRPEVLDGLPAEIERGWSGIGRDFRKRAVGRLLGLAATDPELRPQALMALGLFESQSQMSLPVLREGLADPSPKVRAGAVVGLSGMRPFSPQVESAILGALRDEDDGVRLAAAESARRVARMLREDKSLETARADPNPLVRERVEAALARRGRR